MRRRPVPKPTVQDNVALKAKLFAQQRVAKMIEATRGPSGPGEAATAAAWGREDKLPKLD
eukprot:2174825-Prymnesium_polylepis.1